MKDKPRNLENMVDLLRQGAALIEYSCPACASPLFKLKTGKLWCAQCQKQVIIVREGENIEDTNKPNALSGLESTLLAKIQEVETQIKTEKDPCQLDKLSATLTALLENLEKIRRMKH